jgi:hypothetical protein
LLLAADDPNPIVMLPMYICFSRPAIAAAEAGVPPNLPSGYASSLHSSGGGANS